jgi:hypothetical protein
MNVDLAAFAQRSLLFVRLFFSVSTLEVSNLSVGCLPVNRCTEKGLLK